MDYNLFQVLQAIYDEGSVSRAAQKLFLSQPAISHALARLRDQFNDPLFVRHGRKMIPTERCELIYPKITTGLEALNSTLKSEQVWDVKNVQRTFNLGFRDILETLYFPKLIAHLQSQAPGIKIHSRSVPNHEIPVALQSGELDLAMDTLFATPEYVRNAHLVNDEFVMLCRENHPITENCNLASYKQWPHVVAALKDTDINLVDNALTAQQMYRNVVLRCENFYGAVEVVCNSDLIMTIPKIAAVQFTRHLPVVTLKLPLALPQLSVHLYWWTASESDPGIMWLKQQIAEISESIVRSVT